MTSPSSSLTPKIARGSKSNLIIDTKGPLNHSWVHQIHNRQIIAADFGEGFAVQEKDMVPGSVKWARAHGNYGHRTSTLMPPRDEMEDLVHPLFCRQESLLRLFLMVGLRGFMAWSVRVFIFIVFRLERVDWPKVSSQVGKTSMRMAWKGKSMGFEKIVYRFYHNQTLFGLCILLFPMLVIG